jgi:hypothetical protein
MADGLHIPIRNRIKKLPLALSWVGRGLRGRDDGGNVNNVQYKSNRNCHYESLLYDECILIKNKQTKAKACVGQMVEQLPS